MSLTKRTMKRVESIDKFRGLSIIWMILAHTSLFWLQFRYQWIYGILFIAFDVIGANAFIFVSGLSTSFSYNKKSREINEKISKNENLKEISQFQKAERSKYFAKSIIILFISMVSNAIGTGLNGYIQFRIWVWMVLQTIAIARIFCYPFLKNSPIIRILLGSFFILFADLFNSFFLKAPFLIREFLVQIPHYDTPFPFFGFFFIGSAMGDYFELWNNKINRKNEKNSLIIVPKIIKPKILVISGLICTIFGIIIGLQFTGSLEAQESLWAIQTFEPWSSIYSLPLFLTRNSTSWSIYSIGIELVILSIFINQDIKKENSQYRNYNNIIINNNNNKNNKNDNDNDKNSNVNENITDLDKGLEVFGKNSLTIYITHHIFLILFSRMFNIFEYFLGFLILLFLIYYSIKYYNKKFQGKYTFEWFINHLAQKIVK